MPCCCPTSWLRTVLSIASAVAPETLISALLNFVSAALRLHGGRQSTISRRVADRAGATRVNRRVLHSALAPPFTKLSGSAGVITCRSRRSSKPGEIAPPLGRDEGRFAIVPPGRCGQVPRDALLILSPSAQSARRWCCLAAALPGKEANLPASDTAGHAATTAADDLAVRSTVTEPSIAPRSASSHGASTSTSPGHAQVQAI